MLTKIYTPPNFSVYIQFKKVYKVYFTENVVKRGEIMKKSKRSVIVNLLRASVAISLSVFLAACGGDSGSNVDEQEPQLSSDASAIEESSSSVEKSADSKSSDSKEDGSSSSEVEEDEEAVPTSLDGVSGFSQKGPFIKGSSIKVLELESGRTLKQTGRNFDSKIQTDDGHFKLNAITMVSQYLELHAEGYYRNEVTGQNSSSPLTLYALTDVMMREGGKVNINLLTHLEYQRVIHLVQKQKMKVAAAKDQAQKEILAILNIDGKGFGNSEDLSIVGTTDADGALLAFSILFQGNRSVADLTSLLQSVVSDLEKDGEWNDEKTKTEIADWASAQDLSGGLSTIRSNVKKWNLGSVPDFEKYVRNFWYTNYGLGTCGKKNKAEVKATANERSANYGTQTRYICKDGAWVEATDIEKDFYKSGKDNGDDGELWAGLVTGKKYKYDEMENKWLTPTHNDTTLGLNGCTTNRMGELGKSSTDDIYYVCKEMEYACMDCLDQVYKEMDWERAPAVDYDTYGENCTSADVGKMIPGVVNENYMYYCTANGWVSLDEWSWEVPKEIRFNTAITYGTLTETAERGGQIYKTVTIGEGENAQTWMAENLNYYDATLDGRSWCYDNVEANCVVTGRLYTWAAAVGRSEEECGRSKTCNLGEGNVQGICPDGWHLPSRDEWDLLISNVGGQDGVAKILKSQSGWSNMGCCLNRIDGNGTDAVGFTALPAGMRISEGFDFGGRTAYFWSTSQFNDNVVEAISFSYNRDFAWLIYEDLDICFEYSKDYGMSIRCIKD